VSTDLSPVDVVVRDGSTVCLRQAGGADVEPLTSFVNALSPTSRHEPPAVQPPTRRVVYQPQGTADHVGIRVLEPVALALMGIGLVAADIVWGSGAAVSLSHIPALPMLLLSAMAAASGALSWQRCRAIADAERVSRGIAESLTRLDEMRYALDQAAIVAMTDQRGVITYVNDQFCSISKYSREELLGQDHRIVNSGHHSKEFIRDLWSTIANGRVWRGEIRNRAKDGSFYWVDTTIVPFLDGRGKPRQYLSIRSDITARKHAEAQLREQAALLHLGQLTAMVAHEVRNPLTGLRGSLQILDGRFPAAGPEREVIRTMIQRIDGLNAKVNDLLQYAKPSPLLVRPVPVLTLAREAAASAAAAMGHGGPGISVHGPALSADGDPDTLRAALLNLMLNACQASPGGGVEVEVVAEGGTCRVAVRDRGPGLPQAVRDRLFEPFVTTRAEGTGLGLAIVKRLIEQQGGRISLSDRPGGGTEAIVSLPLARG